MTASLYPWLMPTVVAPRRSRQAIIADVCARHGLDIEEVVGPRRWKLLVLARQEAMWELRQERKPTGEYRFSLPQIGGFFNRDHTTVLHALNRFEARRLDQMMAAA